MSLTTGDRVSITPVSIFKSSSLLTGNRVRVNDTVKRPCQRLVIGDRATSDPIGIMKSECGRICTGTPDLFVQDSGITWGLHASSNGKLTFCNYGGNSFAINCPTGAIHRQGFASIAGTTIARQIEADFSISNTESWGYNLVNAIASFSMSPTTEEYIVMWYVGDTITEITGALFGGSGGTSYELSFYNRPYLMCTDNEPFLYTLGYNGAGTVYLWKYYFSGGLDPKPEEDNTITAAAAPTAFCTDGVYLYLHDGTDLITVSCNTLSEVSRFEYIINAGGMACDSRFWYITDKTNKSVIVMNKGSHYIYDTFNSWPDGVWGKGEFIAPGQIAKYIPL